MLTQVFDEFIEEVKKENPYISGTEIAPIVGSVLEIINNNPDATPQEYIDKLIGGTTYQLEYIRRHLPLPGYTVGAKTDNINLKLTGGYIDSNKREMPENALFDVASVTKFYTQIIAYSLINEGAFDFSSKICDLDDRFTRLGDLTVGDVLSFTAKFKTTETPTNDDFARIDTCENIEDAYKRLYSVKLEEKGTYSYNDLGMMIMKEVMERVTGKSFEQLLKEYITDKAGLKETFLVLPEEKKQLFTGSANIEHGESNDPNALALGGYSGAAGAKVSSDDLLSLGYAFKNGLFIPKYMMADFYTAGAKPIRGKAGNTYVYNKNGVLETFVDRLDASNAFAVQGSTRTNLIIGGSIISILLNPACMSLDEAMEQAEILNQVEIATGKKPAQYVRELHFNRDGKEVKRMLVDARNMVPNKHSIEPLTISMTQLSLQLRFLNKVIKAYDKGYAEKGIEYVKYINPNQTA